MSRDRILFTTAYVDDGLYDYVGQYTPDTRFRDAFPRDISFGLRFIKQNIPFIEILEYPSPDEFKQVLKRGWDVVGFSFYMNETARVLNMIECAREAGVQEIWGGNYGVVNKQIESQFDQRFVGYAEGQLQSLLGLPQTEIIHPPLTMRVALPSQGKNGLTSYPVGVLFTTRGCSFKCTFCQSPAFAPRPLAIPFENVNRVLEFYKSAGISEIFILDENFGNIPKHAERVIQRLSELQLNWTPMTRGDLIARNFDSWNSKGFAGALMGVESMNQEVLNEMHKNSRIENMTSLVTRMNRKNLLTIGFYIIGFESDTPESLRRDLQAVAELNLDLTQICVLTPLPGTPLWDEIDRKYGIFEKDYEKYDAGHLVWHHPHLSPAEARDIVDWSLGFLQSPRTFFRRFVKWQLHRVEKYGRLLAPFLINRTFMRSNFGGPRPLDSRQPLVLFPNGGLNKSAPCPMPALPVSPLRVLPA